MLTAIAWINLFCFTILAAGYLIEGLPAIAGKYLLAGAAIFVILRLMEGWLRRKVVAEDRHGPDH